MYRLRAIGFIAFGILSYLLVLTWVQDQAVLPPAASTPVEPPPGADAPISTADIAAPTAGALNLGEPAIAITPEPSASSDLDLIIPKTPALTQTSNNPTPIRVVTDVLELDINPVGGKISRAALLKYPQSSMDTSPLLLLSTEVPLLAYAQSGIAGPNANPPYRTAVGRYELAGESRLRVPLHWEDSGIRITKTFLFDPGSYLVEVQLRIDNRGAEPLPVFPYGLLRHSGHLPESADTGGPLELPAFFGGATTRPEERYLKLEFEDLTEKAHQHTTTNGWIALVQRYFTTAWIPDPEEAFNYQAHQQDSGKITLGYVASSPVQIAPGKSHQFSSHLYIGPKNKAALAAASPYLDLTLDYGWLFFIGEPLLLLLGFLYGLSGNWGWAIVLLTISIKITFFWLSHKGYRSSAHMRLLQPKLMELKERYGNERAKMSQETLALYRKEGVNPLGGCLPLLIPMPVFLALYWVLLESVELRQEPFMLWITDLSAPDPYLILPLLMGLSMLVMQQLSPPPPNLDPMQARILKFMPVVFTLFFLWFPSGLVLYWLVNNMFSMCHQYWITRSVLTPSSNA